MEKTHQDLNDLYYFVQAVERGGFAPAGRALGLPKSKLSRRIALLEERLQVRLIQRTSRRFAVTDIGKAYFVRCKAMLAEAEAAQSLIDALHAEPCGTIRLACPVGLLHARVGAMLVGFAQQYPEVQIQLAGMNRPADVVRERLDLALRVQPEPLEDTDLAMRVLGHDAPCLVAAAALLDKYPLPACPADLAAWPSLGYGPPMEGHLWTLRGPDGATVAQQHQPVFVTTDMVTLRQAVLGGVGVAQLPAMLVREELATGALVRLLPDWTPRPEVIHLVFPSRRGVPPSVRLLIEFLAAQFAALAGA